MPFTKQLNGKSYKHKEDCNCFRCNKNSNTRCGFKKGNKLGKLNKGRIFTEEHKMKLRLKKLNKPSKLKGRKRPELIGKGTGFKKGNMPWNYGMNTSKSSHWIIMTRKVRCCKKYQEWKNIIYMRDNWTCRHCGIININLEIHHIIRLVTILKNNNIYTLKEAITCNDIWNLNNGITLCHNCHKKTKNYGNRKW